MKKNLIILVVGILGLVLLDQVTKQLIANNLEYAEQIVIIKGFFSITSHRNQGGAWGIFQGKMTFFYIVSVFSAFLFYFLGKDVDFKEKKFYSIAILLMIAGGIGNFIDRLLFQ
jgi:signal peptidase II